jgi:hypothetical protein
MAQTIKLKRGSFTGLSSLSTTYGELILATGSLGSGLSVSPILVANDSIALRPVAGAIITGSTPPDISSYPQLSGLLFYENDAKQFWRLDSAGNQNLPILATVENSLTFGSGLNAGSFNGSSPVTISVNSGSMRVFFNSASYAGISGDILIDPSTGVATIQANSVALGTDTTGNYVATIANATNGGTTINNSGTETAAVTIALNFGDLTEAAVAVGTDYIPFIDGGATGDSRKESIADLVSAVAGTQLVATAGVLSVPALTNLLLATSSYLKSASVIGTTNEIEVTGNGAQGIQIGLPNDVTITGDLAVNGGDITSTAATFNFLTSNVTSLTIGQASTNVVIAGNLDVNGTITTIDSTTLEIGDRIIELAGTATTDGGIYVRDATGAQTGSLLWDVANNYWKGGLKDFEKAFVRTETSTGFTGTPLAFVYASSSNTLDHKSFTYGGVADDGYYLVYSASQFQATKVIDGGTF